MQSPIENIRFQSSYLLHSKKAFFHLSYANSVTLPARQATYAGGTHSLESIPGLHKRLKIRALSKLVSNFIEASQNFDFDFQSTNLPKY
jgi:hypothetical protein